MLFWKNRIKIACIVSFLALILLNSLWVIAGSDNYLCDNQYITYKLLFIKDSDFLYMKSYTFHNIFFDGINLICVFWNKFLFIVLISFAIGLCFADYIKSKSDCIDINCKLPAEIKIFVLLVFLILIIPITNINKEDCSYIEKKYLSEYIPIYDVKKEQFNFNYGRDFENYIKDRFLGRIRLIHLNTIIKYFFGGNFIRFNKILIDVREKFLYEFLKIPPDAAQIQENIYNNIKLLDYYCAKHNIKFYAVVNPVKLSVYPSKFVKNDINAEINRFILSKDKNPKLIFPLEELKKAKEFPSFYTYYKTDSHLTMDGTFIVYNALMKDICKNFTNVKILDKHSFNCDLNKKILSENEYSFGNACRFAGLPNYICDKFHDINYKYYSHKDSKNLKKTDVLIKENIYKSSYFYPNSNNLKVLIFGDSSCENLLKILPYSFTYTDFIRLNDPKNIIPATGERYKVLKYYEEEITDFKPDIIILYIIWDVTAMKNT